MTAPRPPLDYEPNLDWLLEPPGRTFTIGPERGRVPAQRRGIAIANYRARVGGVIRLVGYLDGIPRAGLQVVRVAPRSQRWAVANVFVAPEARRQGWATRLFHEAELLLGRRLEHSQHLSLAATRWIASLG